MPELNSPSGDAITVEVGLLSGRTAAIHAGLDEEVETLKLRAQTALGVRSGRLLNSSGSALLGSAAIKNVGLQEGDVLTMHAQRVQVRGTRHAFVAVLGDGSVATWGAADSGGDSTYVQDQLQNVQACEGTFAALLGDGSVVTGGLARFVGDS